MMVRLVAPAAALCLLAACSMVPTSSEVRVGQALGSGESSQFIRVIAAPPSPGASPVEIVRGFLEANASQQDDWEIARQFLTTDGAAAWDPAQRTRIYDATQLKLTRHGDSVEASLPQVATLGRDGTLLMLPRPRQRSLRYRMAAVRVGGDRPEWRIADPQPGVLVSQAELRRGYRLHQVYFMSNRDQTLVPDGRMVPVVGASLPSRLAELVLAGASAGLAPAVHSGGPGGVQLALGAVPVANGVAVVDLGRQALAASPSQRRELAAQLTWTLTELPDVTAVRITVESEPYEVIGAPALMSRDTWASWGPDQELTGPQGSQLAAHYVLAAGRLTRVSADGAATRTPVSVPGSATALAVSLDESQVALVAEGGRRLILAPLQGSGSSREIAGRDISSVSFDVDGSLWFLDAGRLWRVRVGQEPVVVGLPDDMAGRARGLRLARDGARAALLVDGLPYVAAIAPQVGGDGEGLRLTQPRAVSVGLVRATDLSWQDASTLALLAAAPATSVQVQRLSVGEGLAVPGGSPESPRAVAAAPLVATYAVTRDEGLFIGVGTQWRESGTARAVEYPG
jgi:hypothetical protein